MFCFFLSTIIVFPAALGESSARRPHRRTIFGVIPSGSAAAATPQLSAAQQTLFLVEYVSTALFCFSWQSSQIFLDLQLFLVCVCVYGMT